MKQQVTNNDLANLNEFKDRLSKIGFSVIGIRVCGDFETSEGCVNGTHAGYELTEDHVEIEGVKYKIIPNSTTYFEVYFDVPETIKLI